MSTLVSALFLAAALVPAQCAGGRCAVGRPVAPAFQAAPISAPVTACATGSCAPQGGAYSTPTRQYRAYQGEGRRGAFVRRGWRRR
jgi:hypothetical protein